MKQYLRLMLLCILPISINAQPPNNPIFSGGASDGVAQSAYALAAVNLFAGGEGDGMAYATNGLLPNAVYFGGQGDGFSNQSNNAVPNSIFLGSEGDGFSQQANVAAPNAIYQGGEGDGWHAIVLPLGPLPVELLSFTAEHDGSAHRVKWITAEEINTRHFEVQRSANARDFNTIGTVQPSGSISFGASYLFRVDEPFIGDNFYRLKIVDTDGSFTYSNVVLLKDVAGMKLSVFPNPTAEILNVLIPPVGDVQPVKGEIFDQQGRKILQLLLREGETNSISVGALPAGFYSLRCIINGQTFTLRFMKVK